MYCPGPQIGEGTGQRAGLHLIECSLDMPHPHRPACRPYLPSMQQDQGQSLRLRPSGYRELMVAVRMSGPVVGICQAFLGLVRLGAAAGTPHLQSGASWYW